MSPYKVLGVTPLASDAEIRRAYKALAKKYHPDVNPGDPHASVRMGEINLAYSQVLANRKRNGRGSGATEAPGGQDDPFQRFYSAWAAYDRSVNGEKYQKEDRHRRRVSRWKSANAAVVILLLLMMFLIVRLLLGMLFTDGTSQRTEQRRYVPGYGYYQTIP